MAARVTRRPGGPAVSRPVPGGRLRVRGATAGPGYNPPVSRRAPSTVRPPSPQAGVTLVETLAALTLLGIGLLMAVSVAAWADRVEERARCRSAALELAGSVAEQVRAAPHGWVRTGAVDLSRHVLPASLPEAEVWLEVTEDEDRGLKQVEVDVEWGGTHAGRVVLLTAVGDAELYR